MVNSTGQSKRVSTDATPQDEAAAHPNAAQISQVAQEIFQRGAQASAAGQSGLIQAFSLGLQQTSKLPRTKWAMHQEEAMRAKQKKGAQQKDSPPQSFPPGLLEVVFTDQQVGAAKNRLNGLYKDNHPFRGSCKLTLALHVLLQRLNTIGEGNYSKRFKDEVFTWVGFMLKALFMPLATVEEVRESGAFFRYTVIRKFPEIRRIKEEVCRMFLNVDTRCLDEIWNLFEACYILTLSCPAFLLPFPPMQATLKREDHAKRLANQLGDLCLILEQFKKLYPDCQKYRRFHTGHAKTVEEYVPDYRALQRALTSKQTDKEVYLTLHAAFRRFHLNECVFPLYTSVCEYKCWGIEDPELNQDEIDKSGELFGEIHRFLCGLTLRVYDVLRESAEFLMRPVSSAIDFASYVQVMQLLEVDIGEEIHYFTQGEGSSLIDRLPDESPSDTNFAEIVAVFKEKQWNREEWQQKREMLLTSSKIFESECAASEKVDQLIKLFEALYYDLANNAAGFKSTSDAYRSLERVDPNIASEDKEACDTLLERLVCIKAYRMELIRYLIEVLEDAVLAPFNSAITSPIAEPSSEVSATHSTDTATAAISHRKAKKKRPKVQSSAEATSAQSASIPEPIASEPVEDVEEIESFSALTELCHPERQLRGVEAAVACVALCERVTALHPSAAIHLKHAACCLAEWIEHTQRKESLDFFYGSVDALRRGLEFTLYALRAIYTPAAADMNTHALDVIAHPLFDAPIPTNLFEALNRGWSLLTTLSEANQAINYPLTTSRFRYQRLRNFLSEVRKGMNKKMGHEHRQLMDAGVMCLYNLLEAICSPTSTPRRLNTPKLKVGLVHPPLVAEESVEQLDEAVSIGLTVPTADTSLPWIKKWIELFRRRPLRAPDPHGEFTSLRNHWAEQSMLYLERLEVVLHEPIEQWTPFTALQLLNLMRRLAKGLIASALSHTGCPFEQFENNPRVLARLLPGVIGLPPKCISSAHWVSGYPLDTVRAPKLAGELLFVTEAVNRLIPVLHAIHEAPGQDGYQIGQKRVTVDWYQRQVQQLVERIHEEVCRPTLHYLHVLCRTAFSSHLGI